MRETYLKIIILFLFGLLLASQNIIEIPIIKDVGKSISDHGTYISFPGRFVIGPNGDFFIQDRDRGNILKFSPNGLLVGPVLKLGLSKKEVASLRDFYIKGDRLYVVDEGARAIKVFDLRGKFKFMIKTHDIPGSIAVGPSGLIFVPDYDPKKNTLISVFNSKGKYVGGFGMPFKDQRFTDPKKFYQLQRQITVRVSPSGEIGVLSNVLGIFRKYSATYTMVFERKIEGPEVPKGDLEVFQNTVTVVDAAVDLAMDFRGRFIITLPSTCAYVYDTHGNFLAKIGIKYKGMFLSPHTIFLSGGKMASAGKGEILLLDYGEVEGKL